MKKLGVFVFLAVLFSLTLFVSCGVLPPDVDYVDFTVTAENRHMVGYTGEENEDLVIPATFEYEGVWYSVVNIQYSAFSGCTNLISVSIPHGVTSIGASAFSRCQELTSIDVPNSVKTIGPSAFYDCNDLTEITLTGVTNIGDNAFALCSRLKSMTLGNDLTKVARSAFYGCNPTHVYFYGSKEDWERIDIHSNNKTLINANITFYY